MRMALATSPTLTDPDSVLAVTGDDMANFRTVDCQPAILWSAKVQAKESISQAKGSPDRGPASKETYEQRWIPKSSLSLRSRHKASPPRPVSRQRGKTVPSEARSQPSGCLDSRTFEGPKTRGEDADSVISFTPSMTGRNLAQWFSGLLGRQ
ncbi:hypothetical protein ACN47E_010084 [Coniothyrium glycines]